MYKIIDKKLAENYRMNILSKITVKEKLSNKSNNGLIFALIQSDINTRSEKKQKGEITFMKKYLTLLFITTINKQTKQKKHFLLLLLINAPKASGYGKNKSRCFRRNSPLSHIRGTLINNNNKE